MSSHLSKQSMHGVWTALVTPFVRGQEIDWPAYKKLVENQVQAKVAGIVPCGTTGETPTLSDDEWEKVIKTAVEIARGSQTRVFAGTGTNSTATTIEKTLKAEKLGVDGFLVVTPYYNKPTQQGLLNHYRALLERVQKPVLLYNVPGRTGCTFSAETLATLATDPKVCGVKEASGGLTLMCDVIAKGIEANFAFLAGDDALTLPMLACGGTGIVSVISNAFPTEMVSFLQAWEKGHIKLARAYHHALYPLFRDLFVESNPAPIKALLKTLGLGDGSVRSPLASLSESGGRVLENAHTQVRSQLSALKESAT